MSKDLPQTETGVIKFVNNKSGYGFITGEHVDFFFSLDKFDRWIQIGDEVEFDYTEGPKGFKATNIKKKMGCGSG